MERSDGEQCHGGSPPQFMSLYCTYFDCVIGQRLIGRRPVYYSKFATIWINLA